MTTSPSGATWASSTTLAYAGCTLAALTTSATASSMPPWAAWREPWATGERRSGRALRAAVPLYAFVAQMTDRLHLIVFAVSAAAHAPHRTQTRTNQTCSYRHYSEPHDSLPANF